MTRTSDLDISVESLPGGGVTVRVGGELDMASSMQFEVALLESRSSKRLVIDLTSCTFLDSSAVRVLMSTARTASDDADISVLVRNNPNILRVLEIAAVDKVLPVHTTLEAAL